MPTPRWSFLSSAEYRTILKRLSIFSRARYPCSNSKMRPLQMHARYRLPAVGLNLHPSQGLHERAENMPQYAYF